MKHRIISIITALSLCLSLCPTWAFAVEGEIEILPDEVELADEWDLCTHGERVDDCRICPIEALIAALPRWVTEDNAETVRWQLDEILDLWRELDEDEQEQIDLSPCYELQDQLNVNIPSLIAEAVSYRDCDTNGQNWEEKTCETYTEVVSSTTTTTWSSGWYVVSGSITISKRITVNGDVYLILMDGCVLDAQQGITVNSGKSLTIYAQSDGDNMGSLTAASTGKNFAGIGAGGYNSGGAITINGGAITATGYGDSYNSSAGIGGNSGNSSGTIIINGGVVKATGGDSPYGSAGIGGGDGSSGGTIIINGGTVEAVASGSTYGGAGIGSGGNGAGSTITINGGTVTATGGDGGSGIGNGSEKSGSTITISGGTIIAQGGSGGNAIGGNSNITGGTVNGVSYNTQYQVTFMTNDPNVNLPTQIVVENGTIERPNVIDGYQLSYFEDSSYTKPFNFNTIITKDITIYVKCEEDHNYIASVILEGEDEKKYTLLDSLLNAIEDGNSGTIKLLADIELAQALNFSSDKSFTLDLNGHTLTCDALPLFAVWQGADLTIRGSGSVQSDTSNAVTLAAGTLTLEGGTFSSGRVDGHGINVGEDGSLNVTGPEVTIDRLSVSVGAKVSLSAGKYTGDPAIMVNGHDATLGGPLTPGHAYYGADGKPLVLEGLGEFKEELAAAVLTGPVTVKECTHLGALQDKGDGTHGGNCPYCGTAFAAATHTLGDGNVCEGCNTPLKVQVEMGGTITYYGDIDAAWTAAQGKTATVTLLANVTASYMAVTGGDDITFDGGEFTFTRPSNNNNKFIDITGGKLTVTGGTLKTGETTSGLVSADIFISGGELVVTGGSLEAGTGWVGLVVGGNALVKLSGGTFHGIRMSAPTDTVGRLLLNYGSKNAAEKHYAYYQGDEPVDLTKLDRQYVLTGTVTVGECEHTGITPTPNNDGTHTLKCPYCGYNEAAATNCTYNFSENVGTCPDCKDTLTVLVTGTNNLIYDGTAKTLEVAVKRGEQKLTEGTDYTVSYNENIVAGDASVTVTIGNDQGEYNTTFKISPATPTIAWGADAQTQTLTYTGQPAVITEPDVTLVNGETFSGTINYSYAVGDSTSFTSGLPTDAGTYTIKASVDAEGNYAAATSTNTLTLTIKQAKVTITWDSAPQTRTYTGKPAGITAPTVSAENGLTVSVTPEYSYKAENESTFTNGLPTNAGTYTVRASIAASDNLTAAEADMTLTISKVSLTISDATVTSRPYEAGNTTADVSGVTFSGLVNGEELTKGTDYTATGAFDNANAGEGKSVTVTVTLSDTTKANNYTLDSGTFTTTGEIKKANSTITTAPTATGITYGQALSDSTLSGGTGSAAGTFAWTDGTAKPNAGTASYEVTFTPTDTVNYNTATANVSVTVAPATPNVEAAPTAGAIEYGQKLTDSRLTGGKAVNPHDNADVAGEWKWTAESTQPTGTGTFAATFTPTDNANYETLANVNVSVTVAPATPKLTVNAEPSQQRAGGTVKVTYTVENPNDANLKDNLPTVTLTYTIDGVTKDIDGDSFTIPDKATVGTVITITATSAAVDGKYNSSSNNTATVEVTDKTPVKISGVTVANREYNGDAAGYSGNPVVKTLDGETVTGVTEFDYTWSTGTAPVNAGTYTLTVSVKTDNQQYIGSTTIDFEIAPATITITAPSKEINTGTAAPTFSGDECIIKGLVSPDKLGGQLMVSYAEEPDTSKAGSVAIIASGAEAPAGGNYKSEIIYVPGTLTITRPVQTVIPVNGVRLNRSTQTLEVGERFRLTATVEPANTTESTAVTWSSDNPTIVDVDSNGTVIALKPGTAVITVRTVSRGYTAACTVTVEAPKPETYTITYDANGGSGTMEDGTATENAAFKLPECGFTAPDGKVFDAWAIGSLSGEKAAAGSSHTFTADTTVYALWKDAPAEGYTISYHANGGSGTMADSTAAHGEKFTLPGCSFTAPEGKVFDTWAIGSTDGTQVKAGDSHTFTANTTVYALWKDAPAVTYTIVYHANGGSGTMANSIVPAGEAYILPTCGFTAPEGKEFAGWSIGGTSGVIVEAGGSYTFTRDMTVFAVWKEKPEEPAKTYRITYHANGGTGTMAADTATENEPFTLPECEFTAPAGKVFDTWRIGGTSGTSVKPGEQYTFTADTVVRAVWKDAPAVTYTITYDANGGTGTMANGTAMENIPFALPACGFIAPVGKVFDTWRIGGTSGTSVKPGERYTFTADTVVRAVWKDAPAETHSVTFLPNGGTGTAPTMADTPEGGTFRLPDSSFSREGYQFSGWSYGGVIYAAGTVFTMPNSDVTFTAQWTRLAYAITGNVLYHDGKGVPYATVTLMRGTGTIATERTDANGRFAFSGVPVGTYNLKAEKDGITETVKQEITSSSANLTIILPEGKTNSVIEVKNEETPAVVVGGLNQVFEDTSVYTPEDKEIVNDGGSVEFKLTIEKQDTPTGAVQIEAVKKEKETVALYLDLTLTKTVTQTDGAETSSEVSEIGTLIETIIPLPAEMQGKASYTVYRVHDGKAEPLSQNTGDEYYTVSSDKTTISIFARKYSVYAIAWSDTGTTTPTTPSVTPSRPSGGGGGGSSSVKTYAITVEKSEHGKVTSNHTSAASGTTVTLTVTPDARYVLLDVIVTDSQGNRVTLSEKNTFTMPASAVTVTASFAPIPDESRKQPCDGGAGCPSRAYTDLSAGSWYHEAVDYAIREGLLTGYGDGTFNPNGTLSRAMLAQILYNMEGRPSVNGGSSFLDVTPDSWYANAVAWAAAQGIVGGYGNGKFGPNDSITREQLAVMLWRYNREPAATDKELHFSDANRASSWALEALRWAAENGVLNGKENGTLDPTGTASRAETAQMLHNLSEK